MNMEVCKDARAVALKVDKWLSHQGAHSAYIPAGSTPQPLYSLWREQKPNYLNGLRLIQIDDVLSGKKAGCFREFLSTELAPWKSQISWFKDGSEQADVAILGLGLNGHIAFHEPGIPAGFYSGCVRLSATTIQRLNLEPITWGMTYGVSAFLNCRAIVMMVTGGEKREILNALKNSNSNLPAARLLGHRNFTLFADAAANDSK